MERTREIYPNAPLQLVAFEVRYPTARRAVSEEGLDVFHGQVEALFPILEPATETQLTIGPGGPSEATTRWWRFLNKARTTAVSVHPKRLVVETTHYERYESFREVVQLGLDALAKADRVPVFERIGLRYIDEIRVEATVDAPTDWAPFINEALLQAVSVRPTETKRSGIEGVLRFELEPPHNVMVRFGTLEGEVVGEGALRLKPNKVRKGPFFRIDIDSFFDAEAGKDEFSPQVVLSVCDRLREPVRQVFENCITDRLRNEVLRREL